MSKTRLIIVEGDKEVVNHEVENLTTQIVGHYIQYDKRIEVNGDIAIKQMQQQILSVASKSPPEGISTVTVWVDPE
jgi:divalent metal cation (Fe/Co/Zn/Cd) transporter